MSTHALAELETPPGAGDGRDDGRQRPARHIAAALGLVALLGGLYVLRDTAIGADVGAAVDGVMGELPTTGPAAVMVLVASALNMTAGAALMRLLSGKAFASLALAALAGLVGAVVLDTILLATLGTVGLFSWPALLTANVAVIGLGIAVGRPFVVRPHVPPSPPLRGVASPIVWLIIGLVWAGPLIVQLASPVVPFLDVLPNHVAPVEHLRAFGGINSIDVTPSPIYGPSRIFLGYQALLGTVVAMVDIAAVTGVAAFALPLTLLVGTAGYGLARAIGGPSAGAWALIFVPLSVTFLRLPDARAGVVAFPIAALCMWLLLEADGRPGRRRGVVLTACLAAAILVHPLIGLLTAASVGLVALVRPDRPGWALAAVVAAPLACLGQWLAMLGLDLPPIVALLGLPLSAIPLALATRIGVWSHGRPLAPVARPGAMPAARLVRGLAVAAVAVGAVVALVAPAAVGRIAGGLPGVVEWYLALLAGAVLSLAFARHRRGWALPWSAVAVCALAGAAVAIVPTGSMLGDALRFELPKTLTYFGPTFLAVAAGVGVAALWRTTELSLPARAAVAAMILVLAAAPLRSGVVHPLSLGEHRLSESLSISLRIAGSGYWQGYPDPRRLVDTPRGELVTALRNEIEAGRLTGTTRVLHVADSFQPWAATPLAVFAGVVETSATLDPEDSIHTVGGRLKDVADLPSLLLEDYGYVVLEPDGLEAGTAEMIAAAGFEPIFANDRGTVFRREVSLR